MNLSSSFRYGSLALALLLVYCLFDPRTLVHAAAVVLICTERLDAPHVLHCRHLVLLLEKHAESLGLVTAPNDNADVRTLRERVIARVSIN